MIKFRFLLLLSATFISFSLYAQMYSINSSADDAEESVAFTTVSLSDQLINLTSDPTNPKNRKQVVGFRFNNVMLDKGASVSGCYLMFHVAKASTKFTMLSIRGEKSVNSQAFLTTNRNLSSRMKTMQRINWNKVPQWNSVGQTMKSPDISMVIKEIINQPGWQSGNSIALFIEGNGERHAGSFESGNPVKLVINNNTTPAGSTSTIAQGLGGLTTPRSQAKPAQRSSSLGQSINKKPSGSSLQNKTTSAAKKTSVYSASPGASSHEETINTSQSAATVGIANLAQVTIPQGVAPSGTKASIKKSSRQFKYDEVKFHNIVDVDLSSGEIFKKPLEIKLYYDKAKLTSADNIRPAYFDEAIRQWVDYDEFSLNEQEGSVTFKTYHLTTVSLYEFLTTGMYSNKFENKDCTIYFAAVGSKHYPMENGPYNNHEIEKWYIKPNGDTIWTSFMVQDIAHWISVVKQAYKADPNALWVPNKKINVYIKQDPEMDGEYGPISGCLYINNDQSTKLAGLKPYMLIKSLVAHEMLHLVQDHYYFMQTKGVSRWWFEAFATQGDVLAYGLDKTKVPIPETEKWAKDANSVERSMLKSWDKNDTSPEFYNCGFFLHYLANYRKGYKANLATLMKLGGSNTNLSYYRTIIDDYLKSELNTNISNEWAEYCKWAYENKQSEVKIDATTYASGVHTQMLIPPNFTSGEINKTLPYLSAMVIRLRAPKNIEKNIVTETVVKNIDPGIKLYLCDLDLKEYKPMVAREMKVTKEDGSEMRVTTRTTFSSKFNYTVILAVNTNKDVSGSFHFVTKNLAPPANK